MSQNMGFRFRGLAMGFRDDLGYILARQGALQDHVLHVFWPLFGPNVGIYF